MEKKEIVKYFDEIFKPIDFERRGNSWKHEGKELEKIIHLQKSRYGNTYYLNYGFIIKGLELNNLEMHIYNRLASLDDVENDRIQKLLNLESNISVEQRKIELTPFIYEHLLVELQSINTKKELLKRLKERPHINDIPLIVKQYFHLD